MKGSKILSATAVAALFVIALFAIGYGSPEWATYEVKMGISSPTVPGGVAQVPINMTRCDQDFGGFDLLIQFDPAVLGVDRVEAGEVLTGCSWEYFEYRNDLGTGFLRVVAIADTDSDPATPSCFSGTGSLADVYFQVNQGAPSRSIEPVYFYWGDCSDNVISNIAMDTFYISDNVFDMFGEVVTGLGETGGASPTCMPGPPERVTAQWIEFTHGGVDITTAPPSDCDPNGDGEFWTIADIVFLIQYVFVNGPSPDPFILGDCNCDGRVNLVDIARSINYMFRGGEHPCPPDDMYFRQP